MADFTEVISEKGLTEEINEKDLKINTESENIPKVETKVSHKRNMKKASDCDNDEGEMSVSHQKRKPLKKSKGKSKKRKSKKKKKRKDRRIESSNSDSTDNNEEEWIEKGSLEQEPVINTQLKEIKPSIRDEWMTLPGLFPCISKGSAQSRLFSEKKEQQQDNVLDSQGQHARELNPYWKNGGTGLPTKNVVATVTHEPTDTDVKYVGIAKTKYDGQRRSLGHETNEIVKHPRHSKLMADLKGSKIMPLGQLDGAKRRLNFMELDEEFSKSERQESLPGQEISLTKKEGLESSQLNPNRGTYEEPNNHDDLIKRNPRSKYLNRMIFNKCGGPKRKLDFTDYEQETENSKRQGSLPEREISLTEQEGQESLPEREISLTEQEGQESRQFNLDIGISVAKSRGRTSPSKSFRKPNFDGEDCKIDDHSSFSFKSGEEKDVPFEKNVQLKTNEILSDKEMNELGAKLIKAELMGDTEKAAELQESIEHARTLRSISKVHDKFQPSGSGLTGEEMVILTKIDARGCVQPLRRSAPAEPSGGRRRKQKTETHDEGDRVRYFADDDKHTLNDMFVHEKLNKKEDENEIFSKATLKSLGHGHSEYDIDDLFMDNARFKESDGKVQSKERDKVIREHEKRGKFLKNCKWCLESNNMLKHLVVSMGSTALVCLPPYQSLTEGHCLILPIQHMACSTQLDEDVWQEIQNFKKSITSMFLKMGKDVIFFESIMHLNFFHHMEIQCVPMPKEIGEMAPIYFKKAILECEMEWSTNKKLVDLHQSNVRRAIPKGLPYFAVHFGMEGGFAHVIEDNQLFPKNFAQEIIGGMLDLDPMYWRKPSWEHFEKQREKMLQFVKWWKLYHSDKNQDLSHSDKNQDLSHSDKNQDLSHSDKNQDLSSE